MCLVTWMLAGAESLSALAAPSQELNYSYLYFENGYPTRLSGRRPQSEANLAARANPDLVFQTGYYSLMLDCDDIELKGYDALGGTDYRTALDQDVTMFTPVTSFLLRVTQDGVHYTCNEAVVQAAGVDNVRLIESGQFVKRIDHLGLIFEDANGNALNVDDECRLEITAWPDRITFMLDFSSETSNPITRSTIQVVSPDGTAHLSDVLSNQVRLTVKPQDDAKLAALNVNDYITEATNLQDESALAVSFDEDVHAFHIDVPADAVTYPSASDRVDEYLIEVTNPLATTENIPLVFDQPTVRAVTGTAMVLCDATDGRPLGLPVQISKNWHRKFVDGVYEPTVHDGPWLRGATMLTLDPGESRRVKLRVIYGYWGGAGTVSHAQLSLIGWNCNWKWDESALGAWGESMTYDPTMHAGSAFMDDIRPAFTLSYNDNNSQYADYETTTDYNWTENVGGGDFLVYRDSANVYRWVKRLKTCYYQTGPNQTEVLYGGVTDDDKIRVTYSSRFVSTLDYHRRFHDYKYEFLQDVTSPNRLVFYQMEADYYNTAEYTNYYIGDVDGLVEIGAIDAGGDTYKGSAIAMDGKWLSVDDETANSGNEIARALRGMIPLASTLNGSPLPIYMHKYGVDYGNDMLFDFSAASVMSSYSAGDVVEGEIEFVMPPQHIDNYWGSDAELISRMTSYGDVAWEPVHDELVHNIGLDVVMQQGTLLRNYPLVIQPGGSGSVLSDFTIRGGGLGHIPVRLTGASAGLELAVQRWADGVWTDLESVDIGNNSYYQAIQNADGTMDYGFSIQRPSVDLNAAWRVRVVATENVLDAAGLSSVTSGGLNRDDFGFRKSNISAWAVSNGVLSNSSTSNNNVGEGALAMSLDLSTLAHDSQSIELSFDYTTGDSAEKLYVHVWGYVDVNSTPTSWMMNLGAQNGNAWDASGSALTAYNLGKPDGVFTGTAGSGGDAAIILSGGSGKQRYSGTFDLSAFTSAPNSISGYDYLVIGFAREIGGAVTPAVTISDIVVTLPPAQSSAPTGLTAQDGIAQVSLDWADSGNPDFASYTVYRSATPGSGYVAIATGLTSSDYVDTETNTTLNYYVVTAWNVDGAESEFSTEVSGIANQPARFGSNYYDGGFATERATYSSSLAGAATDQESDAISYSKVSGPDWLSVAADGSLSGTPESGDDGLNDFVVQATSLGGSDTAILSITVYAKYHELLLSEEMDSVTDGGLARDDVGFHKSSTSAWTVSNGVLSNSSTVNSNVAEGALGMMVDLSELDDVPHQQLELSFDYTTNDAGEKLYVHVWGVVDVASSPSTLVMNLAAQNGNAWEAAPDTELAVYNLGKAEGAFVSPEGLGSDAAVILTGSTGAQSFSGTIDLSGFMTAPDSIREYDYLVIGLAREVGGCTSPAVSVSNLSLEMVYQTPPSFYSPLLSLATEGQAYAGSLAGTAFDYDSGDILTYSKVSGPAWLNVAADGTLSGTPQAGDIGLNQFIVQVADGFGGGDTTTLDIEVQPVSQLLLDASGMNSVSSGTLYRDSVGLHKSSSSAWTVSNGVLSNSSTSNSKKAEGALAVMIDVSSVSAWHDQLELSFDYTTGDAAEKLFVHVWGYVDVSSDSSTRTMNLGAQNGNAWESAGGDMLAYNLGKPDGVFTGTAGTGSDAAVILTGATGAQTFSGTFDLSAFTTAPDTVAEYDYIVIGFARDIAGTTSPSVTVSNVELTAKTGSMLSLANSELTVAGTLTGNMFDADSSDDVYESITETLGSNTSELEHKWAFPVSAATESTFYVEAYHSANSEGDGFVFAYSTNDVDYTDMLTVTKTGDDDELQFHVLPSGIGGTVYVRVRDGDRTAGNNQLDTVYIDSLFIHSQ